MGSGPNARCTEWSFLRIPIQLRSSRSEKENGRCLGPPPCHFVGAISPLSMTIYRRWTIEAKKWSSVLSQRLVCRQMARYTLHRQDFVWLATWFYVLAARASLFLVPFLNRASTTASWDEILQVRLSDKSYVYANPSHSCQVRVYFVIFLVFPGTG